MITVNGKEINQGHFPDGTLALKMEDISNAGFITIRWLYENDSELFTLMCLKDYLDRLYRYCSVDLFMPYLPHARMDRVKNKEDVFTLKTFCNAINAMKFNNVIVRDVHSNVSLALLENVIDENVAGWIDTAAENCGAEVLFYPDEGAMKRYSDRAKAPYAFGIKKRDWETGKILGLELMHSDLVKGKDILIVDDICSRGGTFYHSAKALKEAGANKIYLYVSHLETTVFDGELLNSGLIEKIYTTNSIFPKDKQSDMIEILGMDY